MNSARLVLHGDGSHQRLATGLEAGPLTRMSCSKMNRCRLYNLTVANADNRSGWRLHFLGLSGTKDLGSKLGEFAALLRVIQFDRSVIVPAYVSDPFEAPIEHVTIR